MRYRNFIELIFVAGIVFSSGFFFCKDSPYQPEPPEDGVREVIILYTNDEHGWMEPTSTHGGAAGMMGLWKQREGYSADGPYLILSGGDMWTGPAISTWTAGESMVQVMNAMGYSAAAIGNHEFDFKVDGLNRNLSLSQFPYLSANIKTKSTGEIPEFAEPYLIKQVNDVNVGIIGLTTVTTPTSTFPDNVQDYDFIDYAEALEQVVPRVKADGAELIVVAAHICSWEMKALAAKAKSLGVSMIGGGHCTDTININDSGVALVHSGRNMQHYARVQIQYDTVGDTLISISQQLVENKGGTADAEIASIVAYWRDQVDATLSEVIGFTENGIGSRSWAMYNMVTDSWLISYPAAQISCTNAGGIRQSIPSGEITLETIVSVLPFENSIVELELTGSQLMDVVSRLIFGGMTSVGGYRLTDGTPLDPSQTYRVLTIDYLYSRPDYNFQNYDETPYYTSIHYRQPVIDWIKSLNTSPENPLDQYLDNNPR
ncbi:MAG TPA: bifunctional metallophosphatase/5'-nucleotidase [bacterium]|nr:bifunctional metallophosphatase/5'-nucleotidase [bacterium]